LSVEFRQGDVDYEVTTENIAQPIITKSVADSNIAGCDITQVLQVKDVAVDGTVTWVDYDNTADP
jgi:hypothetical protein